MEIVYLDDGNVPIPRVNSQNINHEEQADTARTASGKLRSDRLFEKDVWDYEAEYLTKEQYDEIVALLENSRMTTFWNDEFGGDPATNSIPVKVNITTDERVQWGKSGDWHVEGRTIGLEIIEI